jgi:hypothetical protein
MSEILIAVWINVRKGIAGSYKSSHRRTWCPVYFVSGVPSQHSLGLEALVALERAIRGTLVIYPQQLSAYTAKEALLEITTFKGPMTYCPFCCLMARLLSTLEYINNSF